MLSVGVSEMAAAVEKWELSSDEQLQDLSIPNVNPVLIVMSSTHGYGALWEDSICKIEKRRIRKNFTEEEINYLFSGVKKMGNHWNLILWSYPFQQGRKAVDLAHKYHKLTKRPKCAAP
ncbi:hypothetical protein MC885_003471 [Smutsia gigantea]|nr:hypothetical protein MC885_003471 [Smutsia gigantea]